MSENRLSLSIEKTLRISLFALTAFCFFVFGNETNSYVSLRYLLCLVPAVLSVIYFLFFSRQKHLPFSIYSLALCVLFQGIRFLVNRDSIIYGTPFLDMTLNLLLFLAVFLAFQGRKASNMLLDWIVGITFFLALNAISGLLLKGGGNRWPGYDLPDGSKTFFLPFFYFHPVMKSVLAFRSHPNVTGDIIGLGFYPAVSLVVYALFSFMDKMKKAQRSGAYEGSTGHLISFLSLKVLFALVIASVVFLFFSRGTIIFFVLSLVLFMIGILLKYFSLRMGLLISAIGLIMLTFLAWAGNMKEVIKELRTLKEDQLVLEQETVSSTTKLSASVSYNIEGAKRAKAIYHAHPLWGSGLDGYARLSQDYATPETWERYPMVKASSMSFYLNSLAENGAGAMLYFFFLGSWFIEVIINLVKTQSRFKFLAGLACFSSVLMALGHAAIGYLLESRYVFLLVIIMMGASLTCMQPEPKASKA